MRELIIGFPAKHQSCLHNIHKALNLVCSADEAIGIHSISSQSQLQSFQREALRIDRTTDTVIIVVGEDLAVEHLKQLMVFSASLEKPFILVFEQVLRYSDPGARLLIAAICQRARYIFTFDNATINMLTHHYQVDGERIIPIQYGCWPATEIEPASHSKNRIALYADSKTITTLEQIIRTIPWLKKVNPNLKIDIYLQDPSLLSSHWIIRNKILINRLNLSSDIAWHTQAKQTISDQSRYYALFIFAWHEGYGGSHCLRYEAMATGGAVVCLEDAFAQEQLTDQRAFIIPLGEAESFSHRLQSWYENLPRQRELKEVAEMTGESHSWLAVAKKIKDKMFVTRQMGNLPNASSFDLEWSPEFKKKYAGILDKLTQSYEPDLEIESLWLLTRLKKDPFSKKELFLPIDLERISNRHLNKMDEHQPFFELTHVLTQLAKLDVPSANASINRLFEKMAPMVHEDYLLIELNYHLTQFMQMQSLNLENKIQERSLYIAQSLLSNTRDKTARNLLFQVKATMTLYEAAQLLLDQEVTNLADRCLSAIEKEVFTSSGYRPTSTIPLEKAVAFSYWISCCYRLQLLSTGLFSAIRRSEQINAWFFGFNDRNKMFFDSSTGLCHVHPNNPHIGCQESCVNSLYFWLMQMNHQDTAIYAHAQEAWLNR